MPTDPESERCGPAGHNMSNQAVGGQKHETGKKGHASSGSRQAACGEPQRGEWSGRTDRKTMSKAPGCGTRTKNGSISSAPVSAVSTSNPSPPSELASSGNMTLRGSAACAACRLRPATPYRRAGESAARSQTRRRAEKRAACGAGGGSAARSQTRRPGRNAIRWHGCAVCGAGECTVGVQGAGARAAPRLRLQLHGDGRVQRVDPDGRGREIVR